MAVLIATFDEDEDVLRPTVVGALGIRNDVPPEVWVLDDGGRAWVSADVRRSWAPATSAAPRRARTRRRGTSTTPCGSSDAEFLVTLDADHVPRPELLERMLGYMADPAVAVVQGPQAFFNRGFGHPRAPRRPPPQRAEHLLRRDPAAGRTATRAAFWCGCPSVLRRAALEDVGGVATAHGGGGRPHEPAC